ncbi:MAG: peroxide stress protein YaaA, partial [Acidaminococcaceae bacterium]|nr:peroxide stress protein YaaA [Acidaminococcaceae bacterium]
YLMPEVEYVTCVFGMRQEGKIKVKATEAKMAHGEMVRWCAEHNVLQIETVKNFDCLGYRYQEDKSTAEKFVFLKG